MSDYFPFHEAPIGNAFFVHFSEQQMNTFIWIERGEKSSVEKKNEILVQ